MKIKKVEKLTKEKWINLYAAHFEHNGHTGRWTYASRRNPKETSTTSDAVMIVPILRQRGQKPKLVLQKEFRVPLGTYNYAFPAGLIEEGETVEDMVSRELAEETGFELKKIKRISPMLTSSAGLTDETVTMAFVDAVPGKATQALESAEEIEVILLDFEQMCQLSDNPDLQIDAKAWCAMFMYQQLGKFA